MPQSTLAKPNTKFLVAATAAPKLIHASRDSAFVSRIVTPTTLPTMSASRGKAKRRTWHFDFGCGTADK